MKSINMTNTYNSVIAVNLREKCNGNERSETLLTSPDEYFDYLKHNPHLAEKINFKQIKPIFDLDFDDIDEKHEFSAIEEMQNNVIPLYILEIKNNFPDKNILVMKRNPRKIKKGNEIKWKISLRFVVQNTRISPNILKKMYENYNYIKLHPFDLSIYSKNRGLYLPFTTKHKDSEKSIDEEEYKIIPIDKFDKNDIFNYCCSYIEECYEDWDKRFEDTKLTFKKIEIDDGVDKEVDDSKLVNKIEGYISRLSEKRATDYETWVNCLFCIANICLKHNIKRRKRDDLIHKFSEKSKTKYNEDEVDKWIESNLQNLRDKSYGWNYLKYTCLKEDDPEYFEKNIGKTYEYVKEQFEKDVAKFMNPVGFMRIKENEFEDLNNPFQLLDKSKLLTAYSNLFYWNYDKSKEKWLKLKFVPNWLEDEHMKQYEKMVFKPYHLTEQQNKKYYNLYKGTRAEKIECDNIDYTIIQPILDHIKNVMVAGKEEDFKWFLQYLAQIIRSPDKKTDVAIIFHGKQGCGKNIFIDFFANGILGTDLALSTANPLKTVFHQFNSCIINKILLVCNEIGGEMYGLIDKIKDLITAPSIDTEKKFSDRITVDNYINCICTTNNTNPIPIPLDDRRFVWFDCDNSKIGDVNYFSNLAKLMNDDKTVYTFYHYLKNEINITITNFQTTRPITEAYKKIQNLNIPNYIRFSQEYVKENTFKLYNNKQVHIIKRKEFFMNYINWCERNKYTPFKQNTFYHHIEEDNNGIYLRTHKGSEVYQIIKSEYDEYINNCGCNLKIRGITELEFNYNELSSFIDDDEANE